METFKRIITTLIFLPVLYVGLMDNTYHALYFSLGVILIGFLGYLELRNILFKSGFFHTFFVPLGLAVIYAGFFYKDYSVLLGMIVFLFVAESSYWIIRSKDFTKSLGHIISGIFVLFYLGFMWGSTILLRQWNGGEILPQSGSILGTYHFLLLLTGTWMCDIGAYFGGRWFGKTKLHLPISPNKTLEGFIAGIVVSLLSLWGMSVILEFPFHIGMVLIPLAGIIGDLFESLMKRAANIKDSGSLIPGHGGILDIFDALIFTAPIYYFCILSWIEV